MQVYVVAVHLIEPAQNNLNGYPSARVCVCSTADKAMDAVRALVAEYREEPLPAEDLAEIRDVLDREGAAHYFNQLNVFASVRVDRVTVDGASRQTRSRSRSMAQTKIVGHWWV